MKANIFKIIAILLFLTGCFCSCENAIDELEISPDSKSQVIEKEIEGITFKFCLLNEQGQPATVFKEGENFSFYFSVTNKRNEKIIYVPEIVQSNDNSFCRIFNNENQDFGKPYIYRGVNLIGLGAFIREINEICKFRQSWNDEREHWQWEHTHLESSHRELLKRGDYYTEVEHKFEFVQEDGQTKFYTDFVNFRINFQIR